MRRKTLVNERLKSALVVKPKGTGASRVLAVQRARGDRTDRRRGAPPRLRRGEEFS